MKVTVFTSNQPRHIALIESLVTVADEVFAVQECNTVFPGQVADFYRKSDVMQRYMDRVMRAEGEVFGRPRFAPRGVRSLALRMGDLNRVPMADLDDALRSDAYVVFGASYIKGPLIEFLVARRAINIHMGISPHYRGSSCNFWAMYDGRPDYVGATVHLLSAGLDSGAMLCHAVPRVDAVDGFVLGMRAVKAAHDALVTHLASGALAAMAPVPQDKTQEMRYSRYSDFTDEVAAEYLDREPSPAAVRDALAARDDAALLRPHVA